MLWFDGDWERDDEQWRLEELRDLPQMWAPGVIVNSRMGKYDDYGPPDLYSGAGDAVTFNH